MYFWGAWKHTSRGSSPQNWKRAESDAVALVPFESFSSIKWDFIRSIILCILGAKQTKGWAQAGTSSKCPPPHVHHGGTVTTKYGSFLSTAHATRQVPTGISVLWIDDSADYWLEFWWVKMFSIWYFFFSSLMELFHSWDSSIISHRLGYYSSKRDGGTWKKEEGINIIFFQNCTILWLNS